MTSVGGRSSLSFSEKHVWDQLFTVDTIWNIGETGDMYCTVGIWIKDRPSIQIMDICLIIEWSVIQAMNGITD